MNLVYLVYVFEYIDTDSCPEGTYEHWKCHKDDIKETVKKISEQYDICEEDELENLLGEVSVGSYIDCEDFGGASWAIEIL